MSFVKKELRKQNYTGCFQILWPKASRFSTLHKNITDSHLSLSLVFSFLWITSTLLTVNIVITLNYCLFFHNVLEYLIVSSRSPLKVIKLKEVS